MWYFFITHLLSLQTTYIRNRVYAIWPFSTNFQQICWKFVENKSWVNKFSNPLPTEKLWTPTNFQQFFFVHSGLFDTFSLFLGVNFCLFDNCCNKSHTQPRKSWKFVEKSYRIHHFQPTKKKVGKLLKGQIAYTLIRKSFAEVWYFFITLHPKNYSKNITLLRVLRFCYLGN